MSQHPGLETLARLCLDSVKPTNQFLTFLFLLTFTYQASAQVTDVKLDFSDERGFYEAPFDLVISSTDPTATIRYTLDGSEPSTTRGLVYNGSIQVLSLIHI